MGTIVAHGAEGLDKVFAVTRRPADKPERMPRAFAANPAARRIRGWKAWRLQPAC
jgi:hypothetical protein